MKFTRRVNARVDPFLFLALSPRRVNARVDPFLFLALSPRRVNARVDPDAVTIGKSMVSRNPLLVTESGVDGARVPPKNPVGGALSLPKGVEYL